MSKEFMVSSREPEYLSSHFPCPPGCFPRNPGRGRITWSVAWTVCTLLAVIFIGLAPVMSPVGHAAADSPDIISVFDTGTTPQSHAMRNEV
jgi:hypothetical protein